MTTKSKPVRHPAKFSDAILSEIDVILDDLVRSGALVQGASILDPFAGIGKVHGLRRIGFETIGVEIEPEWAEQHPGTLVGDATALEFEDGFFDAVVTSPCYGNRMADSHEARDLCKACKDRPVHEVRDCSMCGGLGLSKRNTYRHALGRPLSDGSAGGLQWGASYRNLHERAWREGVRVVRPGGFLIVNISNHIRDGEEQRVVEWHLNTLLLIGCFLHEVRRVATPRLGFGANGDARVDGESIIVVRTPPPGPPRLL